MPRTLRPVVHPDESTLLGDSYGCAALPTAGVHAGGSLAGNDSSAALFTCPASPIASGRTAPARHLRLASCDVVSEADKRRAGGNKGEPEHAYRARTRMFVILTIPDTSGRSMHSEIAGLFCHRATGSNTKAIACPPGDEHLARDAV